MGKSKELAELGDVVTQSGGNVGIGISTVVAPLHVGTEGTHGITAWFGDESSFVDNASYHYTDARVGISGRDSDNTDHGAGIEFTSRNTGSSNWLHGYLVHNRDGAFAFGTGGAGTSSAPERMRIDASGRVTMPYQVCGMAVGNSNTTVAHSTGHILDFFQSTYSTGGVSFSNNGRWTVPVAGRYLINFAVYAYPQVSYGARHIAIALNKNGSQVTYEQWEFTGYAYDTRNDHHISTSCIANASANDYFDLQLYTDISTDLFHGPANNRFQIYLLG